MCFNKHTEVQTHKAVLRNCKTETEAFEKRTNQRRVGEIAESENGLGSIH